VEQAMTTFVLTGKYGKNLVLSNKPAPDSDPTARAKTVLERLISEDRVAAVQSGLLGPLDPSGDDSRRDRRS
jgi:hypothetical protein